MKTAFIFIVLLAYVCGVDQSTHCNMVCPMSWIPLCGSDGHTYSNECELRVTNCLQKSNIVKIRSGTCDADTTG